MMAFDLLDDHVTQTHPTPVFGQAVLPEAHVCGLYAGSLLMLFDADESYV